MLKLVLASQSPRRRELLNSAAYEFTVSTVKVSEIFDESLNPQEVASHLATLKARACLDQHKSLNSPGYLILSADTIVVLGDQILGKPESAAQAEDFLRRLSSNTHRVMTGVALLESGSTKTWTGVEITEVKFRELSAEEIRTYVADGEPMDKAGAYGIQGDGGKFVSSVHGSWSNVVGLPLERLERALKENGWTVGRHSPQKSE
ncbi:MAG: septum formation protein Maf [Bdellovibrionales bacterium]|nr:septum formation protein Maf [Bdellovibrionales bacterium]